VLEAEFVEVGAVDPAVYEARNYRDASLMGLEAIRRGPLTWDAITRVHRVLVAGARNDGEGIRSTQSWMGAGTIEAAPYVAPPPGPLLDEVLADWERWTVAPHPFDDVAAVAIAHYQFLNAHPYRDGNGRVARLVSVLQLVAAGLISHPLP